MKQEPAQRTSDAICFWHSTVAAGRAVPLPAGGAWPTAELVQFAAAVDLQLRPLVVLAIVGGVELFRLPQVIGGEDGDRPARVRYGVDVEGGTLTPGHRPEGSLAEGAAWAEVSQRVSLGKRLTRPRIDLGPAVLLVRSDAGVEDLLLALSDDEYGTQGRQPVLQGDHACVDAGVGGVVQVGDVLGFNAGGGDNSSRVGRRGAGVGERSGRTRTQGVWPRRRGRRVCRRPRWSGRPANVRVRGRG